MTRRPALGRLPEALLLALLLGPRATAADLDLTRAVVVAPPGLAGPERQAVRMLVEEVARRSWARWDTTDRLPPAGQPAILVGPVAAVKKFVKFRPWGLDREGFHLGVAGSTVPP